MTNVVAFKPRQPEPPEDEYPHIQTGRTFTIHEIAKGVELALMVTKKPAIVKFFMAKIREGIKNKQHCVMFTVEEANKYFDYLATGETETNNKYRRDLVRCLIAYCKMVDELNSE